MDWGFQYIMKNGIELENSYPYTALTGTCSSSSTKNSVCTVSNFCDVAVNNPTALKEAAY